MQCPQCGAIAVPQQKFCAICGSSLVTITAPLTDTSESSVAATRADEAPAHPTGTNLMPYQSPAEAALTTGRASSRIPFALVVGIALLVILGTLIVVAIASTGSQGGGTSGPRAVAPTTVISQADAAGLLDKSAEAMKVVRTLHYRSEAGFYTPSGDSAALRSASPLSMTLNGDVALPDRYTMNTDATLGNFIVIGGTTWNRTGTNSKWTRSSTAEVGLGPVNPLAVANYMQYYKPGTPQQISTETKDGAALRRVRFDVDTVRMAQAAGDPSVQGLINQSQITADVWIRESDNLLDSISLGVDMSNGTGVILRSFFSGYNEEVVISPPEP